MFTINGEEWWIKFVPPNDKILRMRNGVYTIGACDDITNTIYLVNTLEGRMLEKVLCHEIVHAAMYSYNVDLDNREEEILADLVATYGEEIIEITKGLLKK